MTVEVEDDTTSAEEEDTTSVLDAMEIKRLKRLDQLSFARKKAAEMKKARSAPKRELKRLEEEIKERLFQADVQRVNQLRELHANAPPPTEPMTFLPVTQKKNVTPQKHSSFERKASHIDDLIKILYA